MKLQIATLLMLFSSFSIADKASYESPKTDLDPTYTVVKKNEDKNFKGTLFLILKAASLKFYVME